MIVDASVFLKAFLSDESHQDQAHALIQAHVSGEVLLAAPTLLEYEITNALVQATRRERLSPQTSTDILDAFARLRIELLSVPPAQVYAIAAAYARSAYDAAYLALARSRDEQLITADRRLYNAVESRTDWVLWIGDYQT